MLKTILENYYNKHNNLTPNTTYRYLNKSTYEVTNTPICDTIWTILYTPTPLKFKLSYMFMWKKHS